MSAPAKVTSCKIEDGKITIFSRPSSRTKNLFYQFNYPGTIGKYERRTTGTSDLEEAKAFAQARYSRVCILTEEGYSVHMPTVEDVCRRYIEFWDRLLEENEVTAGTYKNFIYPLLNYIIPYFGKTLVIKVTQEQVDRYPTWRLKERERLAREARENNYKIKVPYKYFDEKKQAYVTRTKEMPFNIWAQRVPTKRSMQGEIQLLVRAINHAVETRKIKDSERPFIWLPKRIRLRRGYFNDTGKQSAPENTFAKLELALFENHIETTNKDGSTKAIHHRFMAEQLVCWSYLMLLSGLRTNEMIALKHGDIHIDKDDDVIITIRPRPGEKRHKRRHRKVVCHQDAIYEWKNILAMRQEWFVERLGFPETPTQDEPIWLNWHGQQETRHIQQRFQDLLKKVDLLLDQDGNKLSAYSLRHTYCVRELREGTPIYSLALNMGTSVESIERYYGPIMDTLAMKAINRRRAQLGKQQIQRLSDQQRAKQVKPFVKRGDRH